MRWATFSAALRLFLNAICYEERAYLRAQFAEAWDEKTKEQIRTHLAGLWQMCEKVLEINPDFAPAANNLAWLLLQQGQDPDRALNLAKKAKAQTPSEPI